ncbi:unnamed protein product [Ceratitis capitata]|uniref:(Mediterranean fruit fly) hypothetical protein n=1 Tax=Ceratitis capitata TaxID=7213 RepID=A0A811V4C7_CERCA|nr:unnamed protein product [Ceratitis capitata]
MEAAHYTPPVDELLPEREISCTYSGCGSIFKNVGNLDMHMKRHHGVEPLKKFNFDGAHYFFHCPKVQCAYHEKHVAKMYFKSLKYLRQHFKKVHMAKTIVCDRCGKAFISAGQLKVHTEKLCGVLFTCNECGWNYNTENKSNDRETQTEELVIKPVEKIVSTSTNVKESNMSPVRDVSTNTHSKTEIPLPRHIETQTDSLLIDSSHHTTLNSLNVPIDNTLNSGPLLPPSNHTYTQTYDDLFTDSLLCFSDIQTQTNWSSFPDAVTDSPTVEEISRHPYNAHNIGTCTRCASDELLVSTETQTSFTQCLLESRTANGDTEVGNFSNLYQTQHTQTCDMLLGALFGAQESDLIGGFQSTYTQT